MISIKSNKTNRAQSKRINEKVSLNRFQTRIIVSSTQKDKCTEESP